MEGFLPFERQKSTGDESTSRSHARMGRIVDGFENGAAKINRSKMAKNACRGVTKQQDTLHQSGRNFKIWIRLDLLDLRTL